MQSIDLGLVLFAFRCEQGREPADGDELLHWIALVGFWYICAEYGVPWESQKHLQPSRPLRFTRRET